MIDAPVGDLSPWGTLRSRELEREYRRGQLPQDARFALIVVAVGQLAFVPAINDYRFFGLTGTFWSLIAARGGFVVASVVAWLVLRRPDRTVVAMDRTLLGWCLALTGMNLYIVTTRPPGQAGHLLATLTITMAFYAINLLPVLLQAIPALVTASTSLLLAWWSKPALDQGSLTTFALTLLIVNLLGAMVSIHRHRSKREQFLALRREMVLRHGLEQALAEIRTLEGILPICGHCRRVRTEAEEWLPLEQFVTERTEADFSHGICGDCLQTHYSDD